LFNVLIDKNYASLKHKVRKFLNNIHSSKVGESFWMLLQISSLTGTFFFLFICKIRCTTLKIIDQLLEANLEDALCQKKPKATGTAS